jgi:histidinol phosphatase-like enzyme
MKMNNALVLFLDLDGVLITTPAWKPDEIDSDGYSKFEQSCVDNLNQLLETVLKIIDVAASA